MRNYIVIANNPKEIEIIYESLLQIPTVKEVFFFTSNNIETLFTADINGDVIICAIDILQKELQHRLSTKFLNAPLISICNMKEIAIQQPNKQLFGYLPAPVTYERVIALVQNIDTMFIQKVIAIEGKKDYVFIKSEYKLIRINFKDILFIAGMKDYTQVFIKGKTTPLTTLQNLKEFETKLPEDSFIRVHRSYIIALNHIDAIVRNEIVIGTQNIPIGDAYRQILDTIIAKNS